MHANTTPYPEVNALLAQILAGVQGILGETLVGMYLYGSLASGDFDPASSDVDFAVVTSEPLGEGEVDALRRMHEALAMNGGEWARRLEGAYVTREWLRRDDPEDASRFPCFTEDTPFGRYRPGWDWTINRYVLREYGVVLYGPSPATLIDPISREELQKGVREALGHLWADLARGTDAPHWLHERRYQVFVILTMCRALYVLDRGAFVSKPTAGAWAEQHLGPEWTPLVRWALASRDDRTMDDTRLGETLDFVRFTLARAGLAAI